ncbi:hypothetical protein ACFL67_02495 [candidate division KSB1 bacterium]
MKNEPAFLNRRELLKTGIAAMGFSLIPERMVSLSDNLNKETVIHADEEQQRFLEIVTKYGGEFGSARPIERRK